MDTPDQNGGNELSEQKPRSRELASGTQRTTLCVRTSPDLTVSCLPLPQAFG